MKKIKLIKGMVLLFFAIGTINLFTNCEKEDVETPAILVVDGNGHSRFDGNGLNSQLNNLPKEPLSANEAAGLFFMREEEKLAHDVYAKLFEKWGVRIFDNIAASELTHTAAVKLLLDKYDLIDPVGNNEIGVFADTLLQDLYNNLITVGFLNEIDALKVGATIEEIDILDLKNQLNNIVDNQDIELVYSSLQKGSRNHLRAFVKNLKNRGVTYEAQYLSQEEYQAIIDSGMETGGH